MLDFSAAKYYLLMFWFILLYSDRHKNRSGITVEDLQYLKDIREINGYLSIQEAPDNLTDLSFLSGLRIIHGRYTS